MFGVGQVPATVACRICDIARTREPPVSSCREPERVLTYQCVITYLGKQCEACCRCHATQNGPESTSADPTSPRKRCSEAREPILERQHSDTCQDRGLAPSARGPSIAKRQVAGSSMSQCEAEQLFHERLGDAAHVGQGLAHVTLEMYTFAGLG